MAEERTYTDDEVQQAYEEWVACPSCKALLVVRALSQEVFGDDDAEMSRWVQAASGVSEIELRHRREAHPVLLWDQARRAAASAAEREPMAS